MLARLKTLAQTARMHAGFRRYAANTSWMFAEQTLRMVSGLLVGIWVARYLGPEQFGLFSYALAYAALFGSLAKLGLDSIVVRELVRNPDKRDVYLGTAFWLKIIGAGLMLCAIALSMQFTSSDDTTKLYILIIAFGSVFQASEVVDFYFQSRVLSKLVSLCKLVQLFLSSLFKLYFIYIDAGLFWFVAVSFFDQVTLAAALFFAYRYQKIDSYLSSFELEIAKNFLRDSWPLILSALVVMIYMRIDQIMIKEMLGIKEVGVYSAAVRLTEIWYFLPTIITGSLFPAIINAKNINEKNYYHRLQQLYTLMVWSALSIIIVVSLFGEWIIETLYGVAYKDAVGVLAINVWAAIFVFYGSAWSKWMLVEGGMKMSAFFQVNAMFFNVILNLFLIPKYGIYGAALSTLFSSAIGHTLLPLFIKSQRVALKMLVISFNPLFLMPAKNEKIS